MIRAVALLLLCALSAMGQASYWFNNWERAGNAQQAQQYFMLPGTGINFTYDAALQHVTINGAAPYTDPFWTAYTNPPFGVMNKNNDVVTLFTAESEPNSNSPPYALQLFDINPNSPGGFVGIKSSGTFIFSENPINAHFGNTSLVLDYGTAPCASDVSIPYLNLNSFGSTMLSLWGDNYNCATVQSPLAAMECPALAGQLNSAGGIPCPSGIYFLANGGVALGSLGYILFGEGGGGGFMEPTNTPYGIEVNMVPVSGIPGYIVVNGGIAFYANGGVVATTNWVNEHFTTNINTIQINTNGVTCLLSARIVNFVQGTNIHFGISTDADDQFRLEIDSTAITNAGSGGPTTLTGDALGSGTSTIAVTVTNIEPPAGAGSPAQVLTKNSTGVVWSNLPPAVGAASATNVWQLNGNTLGQSNSFLGTLDNEPVRFKMDGNLVGMMDTNNSVAWGSRANAIASSSVAIGFLAQASGAGSVVIGQGVATGQGSLAVGGNSSASGNYSVAFPFSSSLGDYSFAAGNGAGANNAGSFVWNDNSGNWFSSDTGPNQWWVGSSGGMFFETLGAGLWIDSQYGPSTISLANGNVTSPSFTLNGVTITSWPSGGSGGIGSPIWVLTNGTQISSATVSNLNFTGNGITIQGTNVNGQANLLFTYPPINNFTSAVQSGMKVWLTAEKGVYQDSGSTLSSNRGPVLSWFDQSPNLVNFTNKTTNPSAPAYESNMGPNGYPCIYFNSYGSPSTNYLLSKSGLGLVAPIYVFAVIKGAACTVLDSQSSGGGNRLLLQCGSTWQIFASGSGLTSTEYPLSDWSLVTWAFINGTSFYRLNGLTINSAAQTTSTIQSMTLGADFNPNGAYPFRLAELQIYTNALSSTTLTNIENGLRTKYNLY